ncbi:GNAT family N-acetyltransferase [Tenuibacillus multivorans]|uniref:Phosphinothricin acetyltransferase n=1 Tax=Tenuibacillus multivorans TaxID=237069 RepID=A0A1H0ATV3_9BACI|nr:GNAT family N-acetyltransferase [Tenuibacillus multivorans]GEL77836.1 N-acetyltransferase [Tenuibacillus multivorans]SDN36503.1 phosphinothricin acetyltransferase [Tenuibacillus multivorans]
MIRTAKEEDIRAILEIYNDAIVNTTAVYDYEPYSYENRKQWFEQKKKAGQPLIVYEDQGKIIGFATYGPFRERPAYKYTVEHSVYVKDHSSRKGVGSTLLKEIIKIARENKYKMMIGMIDAANTGSIKLHEKLGFEHAGTIKNSGYKFNQWLDLAFYQLELPGPNNPIES